MQILEYVLVFNLQQKYLKGNNTYIVVIVNSYL